MNKGIERKSIIGEYGEMTEKLFEDGPGSLSFRNKKFSDLFAWQRLSVNLSLEILAPPGIIWNSDVKAECRDSYKMDGLIIEELEWRLPFGPVTEALFIKPAGAKGPLPGILALHDHGGKKFWGYKKIARGKTDPPPLMEKHHNEYYSGLCWANEAAKQGFAVLVHDTFPFASRRVRIGDTAETAQRGYSVEEPVTDDEIEAYNDWAAGHEHDMAKSLISAGTTWPGVTLAEDRIALNVLSSRDDVDSGRIGCGGLSGGGMRTVFLAGFDERIKCAVCSGFMTTWKDFSLFSASNHTWMTFVPGIPDMLDFPEILGLGVPKPVLVQNCNDDPLYTIEGMRDADRILNEVYKKAKAEENYRCSFYPGGHKFDSAMQKEAFEWYKDRLD